MFFFLTHKVSMFGQKNITEERVPIFVLSTGMFKFTRAEKCRFLLGSAWRRFCLPADVLQPS